VAGRAEQVGAYDFTPALQLRKKSQGFLALFSPHRSSPQPFSPPRLAGLRMLPFLFSPGVIARADMRCSGFTSVFRKVPL
jgi:hypothetical protein